MSKLNDGFAFQLTASQINHKREYLAIPGRRFRYDFYITYGWGGRLLVELQGGVYQYKPSHASAGGIRRDAEKSNLATLHGYKLLKFTSDMVASGEALRMVEEVIGGKNDTN